MILEVTEIHIHPGQQEAFDAAIARGIASYIVSAKGYLGHRVVKGIESPERYILIIHWESVDDHMVGFRQSPAFTEWRGVVGPFFAQPPHMEHFHSLEVAGAQGR